MLWALMLAVLCVAFTNGANANFKGVASLYGSGTTSLRTALLWGTATTFAGSMMAIWQASGLLNTFSGRGVVDDATAARPEFALAVAVGTAATSFLATRLGFPVSTTHALVGSLAGAGWMATKSMAPAALWKLFVFPLLFSPILAALLGSAVIMLWGKRLASWEAAGTSLSPLHFLSSWAASFARGMNDTPKMAALLMLIPSMQPSWALMSVAIGIGLGAVLDARPVAETLGKKVSRMDSSQGLAANLVTSLLVTTASCHSYPVSTTHVSVGALLGMGTATGQADWRKGLEILVAWLTTAPFAAVAAIGSWYLIDTFWR
ncbi:MAG: anion permease [Pirellulaceae bacterium]